MRAVQFRSVYRVLSTITPVTRTFTRNTVAMSTAPLSETSVPPKREGDNTSTSTPRAKKAKLRRYRAKKPEPTSPMGVLQFEIDSLLSKHNLTREQVTNDLSAILNDPHKEDADSITNKYHRIVDNVEVLALTSNGDGLALLANPVHPDQQQVCIVPFGLPGDSVRIRVFKSHPLYVESDLLDVRTKSPMRHDELITDKYFGKASGSQFEFLTYAKQLEIKRDTIANAYCYFAPRILADGLVPEIDPTVASPLQYNYRTKITPHFDLPRRAAREPLETCPPLGFGQKGRPEWRKETLKVGGRAGILDIDECALATEILNTGLSNERAKFAKEFKNYKKGATILLRENTIVLDEAKDLRAQLGEASRDANGDVSYVTVDDAEHGVKLAKTCVTDPRQVVAEYVDGYTFNFTAGEFFQNNNSILPIVTKYVRENLQIPNSKEGEPRYLVDAYCGSGLFSVCSSKGVDKVTGVEISADSVSFAERNAKTNGIENCDFIVGKAEKLFETISTPNDRTSVILDPPRKGCDAVFMKQLSDYYPARIVYISCNVHSQARDVEYFLKETEKGSDYKIESVRGFDFFPQTHHVESVCVLSRV